MRDIVVFVLEALYLGCLLAFVALGYSLVYGVLRFVNFAHGEVVSFAGLLAFEVARRLRPDSGLFIGVLSAVLGGVVVGLLLERFVYRSLEKEGSLVLLLASFAASMTLQGGMSLVWGSKSRHIGFTDTLVHFGGAAFYTRYLWLPVVGIGAVVGLEYLLRNSIWGLVARGYVANPIQMKSSGVPVARMVGITFGIAGGLGGIASIFIGLGTGVSPSMGFRYAIWAFAATIIGGLGSLRGTVLGGLILGLLLSVVARFGSALYMDAVAFIIMTGVLIWRPRGLFAFVERRV